jgi:protein-serine/threonine kinase
MAPGDHQRGVPPVVSPRSSSNRNTAQAAASAAERSSRRGGYTNDNTNSPRQATSGDAQNDRVSRSNGNLHTNGADSGGDPAVIAANAAARASRRAQQNDEAVPYRPSSNREPRASTSASAVPRQSSRPEPSREASEVLNRVIISKPEVDIDRERERMAEAIPSSDANDATPRAIPVTDERAEGATRGSRSRHDHAEKSSGKPKNIKFGEYFLGNTLGEGEFGKVKMGWKQEGGVQVSSI